MFLFILTSVIIILFRLKNQMPRRRTAAAFRLIIIGSSRICGTRPFLYPFLRWSPWDFPGKSTGVGCHCLLRWMSINTRIMWPICTINAILQWRNKVQATIWMDLTNSIEWKKRKLSWYTNCMILFISSGKIGKIVLEARITTVLRTEDSVSSSGSCMEQSVSLGKSC